MSRVIKSYMVNVTEDAQKIKVPDIRSFQYDETPVQKQESGEQDDACDSSEESPAEEEYANPEEIIKRAQQEADMIRETAEKDADLIIQKAKLAAEAEKIAAKEVGNKEGYEEGSARAKEEHQGIMDEANRTLLSAREEKAAVIQETEPEMVSLVIDIVDKLLGDAVKLNPGIVRHMIKQGVGEASGADELSVRVSKDDYDAVLKMKDEIASYVDSDTALSIIKDTALSAGDCIIDTPIGSIDSSLSNQWDSLKSDLIHIMRNNEL